MSIIKITRKHEWADMLRVYKIFIDDIHSGNIKRNETKEFYVDNGVHVVCAKIDWVRSNDVSVDVNNAMVELEVGSTVALQKAQIPFIEMVVCGDIIKTLFAILFQKFINIMAYISVWRNNYLWIREK